MNVISSIYIPFVEGFINAQYIIDAFYCKEIATISRVTLVPSAPSKYSGEIYCQAFIDIDSWHETEAAYNFIQSLKVSTNETRFNHSHTNWWLVEINEKPWITSMELFRENTFINELLYVDIYAIICDLVPAFRHAVSEIGDKFFNSLDDPDWKDIETSLYEEKAYQQLEDDLCL